MKIAIVWSCNRIQYEFSLLHKICKNKIIRCWVIAKTLFWHSRRLPSWIWKIFNVGEMTVIFIGICFSASNFIKIGHVLIEMWRVNNFKIAAICHIRFSKFTLYVTWPFWHAILLHTAKICLVMSNNDFKDGGHPPSWIIKVLIFGHLTVIKFNICCSKPNFIKIR